MHDKGNFLSEIIVNKRKEVETKKGNADIDTIAKLAYSAKPALSFFEAILNSKPPCIIAEIKRRSPSKGELIKNPDVKNIAIGFNTAGASAISVLTDEKYFGGNNNDLISVKQVVNIPVLRKDFVVDTYQIYESRAIGADTVLLIVKILGSSLMDYIELSRALGMEPLVEIHDDSELKIAVEAGAKIIGINSRNLETFKTNIDTVERIINRIPKNILTIAESGITSIDTISSLLKLGVNGFLIGEAFMRADSPERKLKEFVDKFRISQFIERR
ncbi:MAG: indole-3-glycerol phosphate synthase TrpC [bacterium]